MDGVAFFTDHLRDLPLTAQAVPEGICTSHNRPAPLFRINGHNICRGCALLRQAYPTPTGKSRLSLGSYMLVTETTVDYWGNHLMPSPIRRHSASGALRSIIANLILTPPPPPWLFIAFARSNAADRLYVTVSNDLMFFSGKFLFPGTMDEPPVERLNRKQVIDTHEASRLSRDEWEKVARAHAALNTSPEALTYLQEVYQRYPGLAGVSIPTIRTPEYNAIRLLADMRVSDAV
jgi:hypothetical protein